MNKLKIEKIQTPSPEEWDRIWIACDYATYFHSRGWAEIWQSYTKGIYNPCPKLIVFSDSKTALIPFTVEKRKGIINNYYLTALNNYGNWISGYTLTDNHTNLVVDYLMNNVSNLAWRCNPYDNFKIILNQRNVYFTENDETYVINLKKGYKKVFKDCSHGHKCSFNKAQREGVYIQEATTQKDWEKYYLVYEDSVRRWGDSTLLKLDRSFFSEVCLLSSPNIRLWLAMYNSEVIAGVLCFYSKNHVAAWHASALEKYFSMRPMNILFLEAIRHACEKGYTWFDFNTSSHLEGVRTFKKRFGADELKCNVIYKKSKLVKCFIALKKIYSKKSSNQKSYLKGLSHE